MWFKLIRQTIILFSIIFSSTVYGQLSIIPLSVDYTVYNMNDTLAYVEFHLSFYRTNLEYKFSGDTLKSKFETRLEIKKNGAVFATQIHQFTNTEADTSNINAYDSFIDVFSIVLPFNNFDVTVSLTDLNSGTKGEYKIQASIPGPPDNFFLSDILLSSKIERAAEKTKFTKNGMNVIPHPGNTYNMYHPMLYYYVELNKLSFDDSKGNTYNVNYFVSNEHGDTVKTGKLKTKNILSNSQAEIGGFNALSLKHGVYNLNIRVLDNKSNIASNVKKKFFVHKGRKQKKTENVAAMPEIDEVFLGMKLDELDLEFKKATYIAISDEMEIFSNLDSTRSKQVFLTNFWRTRDRNNQAALGSSRRHYLTLCDEADARFTKGFRKGWKSDQGRIFVKYGNPSDIERVENAINARPHLKWIYDGLEGGNEFIFYDRNGFGDYELIHSSYYKELQNHNWENLISR